MAPHWRPPISPAYAVLLAAVAAHVLTSVAWAGGSAALAWLGPIPGGRVFRRMLRIAGAASLTLGLCLWFGRYGQWGPLQGLAMWLAAAAALLAAWVQNDPAMAAARQLEIETDPAGEARLRRMDWIAAGLLGFATVAMGLARYV